MALANSRSRPRSTSTVDGGVDKPIAGDPAISAGPLVEGDHSGAAEPDVVLESQPGVLDLPGVGLAAQLPDQLGALREARGAERVSLGQQPAGRVGDDLPAVGVVAVQDELLRSPLGGEPERLVADQLVGGEAVVQL